MSEASPDRAGPVDEPVDTVSEEAALMGQLSGVRAVNVEKFEAEFGHAMEAAIASHDVQVELRRLDRTREQIEQMEERIRTGRRLAPSRLAKLYDRLDDLRQEEVSILQRIDELDQNKEAVSAHEKETAPARLESRIKSTSKKRSAPSDAIELSASDTEKEDEANGEQIENVEEEDIGEDVVCDDYNDDYFSDRLNSWTASRPAAEGVYSFASLLSAGGLEEKPIEICSTVDIDGFKIPRVLWEGLLEYQRAGVQWLLGLFSRRTGGILGDEMVGTGGRSSFYMACIGAGKDCSDCGTFGCPPNIR
jgi:SNF2 family DNA or RNA helicase